MRLPSRHSDDADVIRARLRLLLDERAAGEAWIPGGSGADDGFPGWYAVGQSEEAVTASVDADEPDAPSAPRPGVGLPPGIGRHRAPGRETRWDPGRYGARSLWAAALLAALLLVGWTWLNRPRVDPVGGAPSSVVTPPSPSVGEVADTSATVVVSVVGQVASPGLVSLPSGSRAADAVAAAGGLLPGADPASVNLAAVIADGEQLTIGLPGAPGRSPTTGANGSRSATLVNLNTAGAAELDALPGIGPVLAQRIVDFRDRQGPFRSVDALDDVPGIGPAIAAALADLVTV